MYFDQSDQLYRLLHVSNSSSKSNHIFRSVCQEFCSGGGGRRWYLSMHCRSPGPHPGGKLRGLAWVGGYPGPHPGGKLRCLAWGGGSLGPHPGGSWRVWLWGGGLQVHTRVFFSQKLFSMWHSKWQWLLSCLHIIFTSGESCYYRQMLWLRLYYIYFFFEFFLSWASLKTRAWGLVICFPYSSSVIKWRFKWRFDTIVRFYLENDIR